MPDPVISVGIPSQVVLESFKLLKDEVSDNKNKQVASVAGQYQHWRFDE